MKLEKKGKEERALDRELVKGVFISIALALFTVFVAYTLFFK